MLGIAPEGYFHGVPVYSEVDADKIEASAQLSADAATLAGRHEAFRGQAEGFANAPMPDDVKQEDFDAAQKILDARQVMLDIETWGTGSYAAIISIGAVKFSLEGLPDERFYVAVNPASSAKAGMRIEADCLAKFWMKPKQRAALDKWLEQPKVDLAEALLAFSQWYGPDSFPTWSKGASFDLVIVSNAFQLIGETRPWGYPEERCFRTLAAMFSDVVPEPAREGTAHDALDDAVHQTKWLRAIERHITSGERIGVRL